MTAPPHPVAAIDCGTNSTRLLVVDGAGRQLARLMRITRLGQGVDATGVLGAPALRRTLDVLSEYREIVDRHGVDARRAVATSAVRDAGNGDEFLAAAGQVIGAPVELLSGEEEGRLAYAGATAGDPASAPALVVDIGGGSTELIAGSAGGPRAVSMQIGCVRLTERFLRTDPPGADEIASAERLIAAELDGALAVLPLLAARPAGRRLIGLAGTVSTLSMLTQRLTVYDWSRIHHSVLDLSTVDRWCGVLAAEPAAERALRPGMVEGREDVIVAGALVLRGVMRRLGFDRCIVSESDILDGLAESVRAGRRR